MIKKQNTDIDIDKNLAKSLRIAIVKADYHTELTTSLEKYCRKTLVTNGVPEKNIQTFIAPGSWEIPLITQTVAKTKQYDAIITFGVVVKGETHHFDLIANECASALMQISLDYNIPVTFEILAVYEKKHAVERSADNNNNKGIEGASAALKTLNTLRTIQMH